MGDLILLNRDQILGALALKSEDVEVPELGGVVRVREMTAGEQEVYATLVQAENGGVDLRNYRAKLISCCACDASGNLLFAPGDVEALTRLAAEPIDRVWTAAARLNKLLSGDMEALGKALAARGGASSSASPSSSAEPSPKSNEG